MTRKLGVLVRVTPPAKAVRPMYVDTAHFDEALETAGIFHHERILEGMPDGVAVLDCDNVILWANGQFRRWANNENVAGMQFYAAMGNPEILGPDFCPFYTALATDRPCISNLRTNENRYFQVHAAPIQDDDDQRRLIVSVRETTAENLQQQKLEAIHKAGMELADLTPEEVLKMSVEDRVELLKANILHHTQDLLHFDVIEIRLLDQETGLLVPLLSVGMEPDAANRQLYARTQHNGVTGFVAATGKSYLCEDTAEDPLYLQGFVGAKSSLTVPLILHDEVIGTFNVESPEPRAFTDSDLQFLEIFSRNIAVSLNTLELLVAQGAKATMVGVEAIHSAVALPVDEILNDAVNVMERYIGGDAEVTARLNHILKNARDIKQLIQKVGKTLAPTKAVLPAMQVEQRPKLRDRCVLVVDHDETVRVAAHDLLERYGCQVETAHTGSEAVLMVRSSGLAHYQVIIADIRLPDMSGYDFMCKLKEMRDVVPLVLMTGFGYDPGHSIVKARQAGLHAKGVLYKPFRLDQLLETVELIIDSTPTASA